MPVSRHRHLTAGDYLVGAAGFAKKRQSRSGIPVDVLASSVLSIVGHSDWPWGPDFETLKECRDFALSAPRAGHPDMRTQSLIHWSIGSAEREQNTGQPS